MSGGLACGFWLPMLYTKEIIAIQHLIHFYTTRPGTVALYQTRRYPRGMQRWSPHDICLRQIVREKLQQFGGGYSRPKFLSPLWEVPILGGRVLGRLRTEVPESSMRSFNVGRMLFWVVQNTLFCAILTTNASHWVKLSSHIRRVWWAIEAGASKKCKKLLALMGVTQTDPRPI